MRRSFQRGMTLFEILVSLGILVLISMLLYGAFDSMSRGKRAEEMRVDRAKQGREAVLRMSRELQGAFISLHMPSSPALITRTTAFIATSSGNYDRLDFSAFAHRRVDKEAKESDQCELGYFVVKDPEREGKMDLVRREQVLIDQDPKRGGVVNVVAEDVEYFDVKFLDPATGTWVETWDTTQVTGQPGRLPLEARITLKLKGVKNGPSSVYSTKVMIPITAPLSFGMPR